MRFWLAVTGLLCATGVGACQDVPRAKVFGGDSYGNFESPSGRRADIPEVPAAPKPDAPHAFWDRENILLFSGIAATRALDYASTRNFQARGRQEILLPRDVVNNSAAFASIEVAGIAASVGISYWFHRTGHHTLERWFSVVHVAATGFGDARNYALKSKHSQ
jgi:hypothetical protein